MGKIFSQAERRVIEQNNFNRKFSLAQCGASCPNDAPARARTLEAGKRWARLAQARAASRPGSALPRLGAELELRRSGSSLGPSQ